MKKGSGAILGAVDDKLHPTPFVPAAHRLADFLSLTKPRLNSLVVVTAGIGYYLGAGGDLHVATLVQAVLGIALVAGGAAGLNQIYERDTDSLMFRTRMRPLAAQRVTTGEALMFSLALAAAGLGIVAASSNLLAAFLALLTLVSYNVVYTPMKRRSQLATLVGAVPGALAADDWMGRRPRRADARSVGAVRHRLRVADSAFHGDRVAVSRRFRPRGLPAAAGRASRTAEAPRVRPCCSRSCSCPLSLVPYFLRMSGPAYAVGAAAGSVGLLWLAISFALRATDERARLLFLGSITYLPLLWGMLILDRL